MCARCFRFLGLFFVETVVGVFEKNFFVCLFFRGFVTLGEFRYIFFGVFLSFVAFYFFWRGCSCGFWTCFYVFRREAAGLVYFVIR